MVQKSMSKPVFRHRINQSKNRQLSLQISYPGFFLSLSWNIYIILPLSWWNAMQSFISILILIFWIKLFIWRISCILFPFQILILLSMSSQNKINIQNRGGVRESSLHLFKCYLGVNQRCSTDDRNRPSPTWLLPCLFCASGTENLTGTNLCC